MLYNLFSPGSPTAFTAVSNLCHGTPCMEAFHFLAGRCHLLTILSLSFTLLSKHLKEHFAILIYVINFQIWIKGRSKKDTHILYVIMSSPLSNFFQINFLFVDLWVENKKIGSKFIASFTRKGMRILIRELSYTIMKYFLIELAVKCFSYAFSAFSKLPTCFISQWTHADV